MVEGQMTKSLFDLCLRYSARNGILAEPAHLWTPEGDFRWIHRSTVEK